MKTFPKKKRKVIKNYSSKMYQVHMGSQDFENPNVI